jgi:UDP-N-acetylmuramate--alanine ligase
VIRKHGASQKITLQVPGRQYILDALAAIAAADLCGASETSIHDALYDYKGTARRFEYKGSKNGVRFVEDYAHHPTQVALNIDAAEKMPHNRVIALFQPHTYSRTKAFLDEFSDALAKADIVLLTKIYPARETDTLGISSHDLEARIRARGTEVHCFDTFQEVEDWIKANAEKDDIVISMNAGDAVQIEEDLLK